MRNSVGIHKLCIQKRLGWLQIVHHWGLTPTYVDLQFKGQWQELSGHLTLVVTCHVCLKHIETYNAPKHPDISLKTLGTIWNVEHNYETMNPLTASHLNTMQAFKYTKTGCVTLDDPQTMAVRLKPSELPT